MILYQPATDTDVK